MKTEKIPYLLLGFMAFSFMASSIYIINDYRDVEDDRKHPEKCKRPIASGAVAGTTALLIAALLIILASGIAYYLSMKFLFVLGIYFFLNLAYSLGLKSIAILDIFILAAGFVLRVKAGGVIAREGISEWLNIMVFLLAIFMALGKRRDDVLLKISSGMDMRKSIKGYNLELLNVLISLACAVIIIAYFMYTMAPETIQRLGTYRLYYTCLFVMAGIMRYLQIIFVQAASGSPTKILYKDRFIQFTLVCWVASYIAIIYFRDLTLFK